MRSADVFPSKYIHAEDLDGELTVTIEAVTLERMKSNDGKEGEKPVCHFVGNVKPLVLNKTNWAAISKQLGDESDEWPGKQITLMIVPNVPAFGDVVDVIRVKTARQNSKPRPEAKHMTAAEAGEVKTPKGKRVADLNAEEIAKVLATTTNEFAPLRAAVEAWQAAV